MIELVNARKNIDHMNFIFKVRNDKNVRKFSVNKNKILKQEHESWYLDDKKKKIFIIKYKNHNIGYIRAENKRNPFLSWAILPKFRGKKLGEISLKKFIKRMKFKSCLAKIDKDNIPSILMVIKNNFKFEFKEKNFVIFKLKK